MSFIFFTFFVLAPLPLYAIILDDFRTPEFYTIQNSDGTNVEVHRNMPSERTSLFTLSDNNLNYNHLKPTEEKSKNVSARSINYSFAQPLNISSSPYLKCNFKDQSSAFITTFTIGSSNDNNGIKFDYLFDNNKLDKLINLTGNYDTLVSQGTMDFTKISTIEIKMNTSKDGIVPDLNFNMTSLELEAVPEPFSISTLGLGITSFMRKRKQKIKRV